MNKLGKFTRKAGLTLAMALVFAETAGLSAMPVHAATTGTVTCDVLNVRSGGSTSNPVITTVSKGTQVDIVSSANGWYEISINGTTGYVSAQYISTDGTDAGTAVSGQTGSVNVSVLNLRSGASTDTSVIGSLYMGDTVTITESTNGWYGVKTASGATGYVYAQYITVGSGSSAGSDNSGSGTSVSPASGEGVCNTSALNVRTDANTNSSIIGYITYGTKVTITGTAGSWYKVDTTVNGKSVSGFVHGDYITLNSNGGSDNSGSSSVEPASGEGVCNTTALNIRKEATTSSSTYGLIYQGAKVTILGKSGEWYQVKATVNGSVVTGYAHSSYITVSSGSNGDQSSSGVEAASGEGVCNTSALNVRKEASTDSQVIGLIYQNAKVTITGTSGNWYQVKATVNGKSVSGYVYKDYITLSSNGSGSSSSVSEVNETVWATDNVNVRKDSNTSAAIIATIRKGASVKRTGVLSNGWSRVEYNGQTAYICSDYLTTTDPDPDGSDDSEGSSGITGVTGQDIVDYAMQWVGYPYKWGGNDLNTGVDCSGFTQQVYLHFGITLNRIADAQKQNGIRISSVDEAQPGDLFFYGSSSYADHVAIYTGNGTVVHASSPSVGIITSPVSYRTPVAIVRVIY